MKENSNNIITIQICDFCSHDLAQSMAEAIWGEATITGINHIRQEIFDDKTASDGFFVVAFNQEKKVVGRLHCIQSEVVPTLWYDGDLYVVPTYRRMGIARQMVGVAIQHLINMNAQTLRCYVDPQNTPSISLHTSMGFCTKPYEPFGSIDNEGQTMFEYDLPSLWSVIPATCDEAYFVRLMFVGNREALPCDNISMKAWREILGAENPNQKHFLICQGAMPVGYMRVGGVLDPCGANVEMLFVAPKYHGRGIGQYALTWAEGFALACGKDSLCVQVPPHHGVMQHLCQKLGYNPREHDYIKKLS